MVEQTDIMDQVKADLTAFAEEGIVDPPTDEALTDIVAGYERDFGFMGSFDEWVGHHGEQYLVAELVFRYLKQHGVALVHDSECIYGYEDETDGCPALLEAYAGLAGGRLDAMSYTLDGDWSAKEDAHITISVDEQTLEETMVYDGDYADIDSLLALLNRVIETVTDAPERYNRLRFSDGTGVTVGYVHPDHAATLRKCFREAIKARREHRSES